jgi:hypothetical protein
VTVEDRINWCFAFPSFLCLWDGRGLDGLQRVTLLTWRLEVLHTSCLVLVHLERRRGSSETRLDGVHTWELICVSCYGYLCPCPELLVTLLQSPRRKKKGSETPSDISRLLLRERGNTPHTPQPRRHLPTTTHHAISSHLQYAKTHSAPRWAQDTQV